MRYLLYVVLVSMITACSSNSQEEHARRIIEEWQGREIKLPEVMMDALTGDTIDLSDADFTILNYIDSAGCTECKMRLPLWKDFIESIDSIYDVEVQTIFIIHPKDEIKIKFLLNKSGYDYPVFIDKNDEINKCNKFPQETIFQSFLINNNSEVIALGNPVYATDVASLYKNFIVGNRIYSDKYDGMIISNGDIDLGIVNPKDTVSCQFVLTNNCPDSVFIRKIIPSCDCIYANTISSIIPPNSEIVGNITVIADSAQDNFNQLVHIYYENFNNPLIIRIKGIIRKY